MPLRVWNKRGNSMKNRISLTFKVSRKQGEKTGKVFIWTHLVKRGTMQAILSKRKDAKWTPTHRATLKTIVANTLQTLRLNQCRAIFKELHGTITQSARRCLGLFCWLSWQVLASCLHGGVNAMTWHIKIQPYALWIGAHYSQHNRRLCVNLLPCVTVCIVLPGGKIPWLQNMAML